MSGLAGIATAAAAVIRVRAGATWRAPRLGIIVGSGLGAIADDVRDAVRIPFAEIPGMPAAAVEGHPGTVVAGRLSGVSVVMFAGRLHVYEGHTAAVAGFPARVIHACGARTLFVANASGAIDPAFAPGDLMVMTDHLNMTGRSPLEGAMEPGDTRFPDMSMPYDAELRAALHAAGEACGVPLRDGVYGGVLGPAYETRAEIQLLRAAGCDAVGMSTIPEVIVARALGMRVVGLSCLTNMACGVTEGPLAHEEVLRGAAAVDARFRALVQHFVAGL